MKSSIFWEITNSQRFIGAGVLKVEDELEQETVKKSWNSGRSGRAIIEVLSQHLREQKTHENPQSGMPMSENPNTYGIRVETVILLLRTRVACVVTKP
jgi:hypothetical protein